VDPPHADVWIAHEGEDLVSRTAEARFWAKVDRSAGPGACWMWRGARVGRVNEKYGQIRWAGGYAMAHRVAYELMKGLIPAGLITDHLCRVHLCVNPDHIELVTHRINILRGISPPARFAVRTRCNRGHSFGDAYIRGVRSGHNRGRICRSCERERHQAARAKELVR